MFVIVCMWFSLVVLGFVARHLAVSLILQVQHCVFVIICSLVWLCWALVCGHLAVNLILQVQHCVFVIV